MKWFLIGLIGAIAVIFASAGYSYTAGEIPADSEAFITLENQPQDYDIFNPPQIEVSMFADFSDSVVGDFLFCIWDREDLTAAETRLRMSFPEVEQLEKYISFGIRQPDKLKMADGEETSDSISWGWRYARYVTDPITQECKQIDYFTGSDTTQVQLLGLITQIDNLVSNGGDAGKVLRSVADLYGKVEEVKNELRIMRQITGDTKQQESQ